MRKVAGTDTLPFASILFVALERNRDITQDFRFRDDDPGTRDRYAFENTKILSASPCDCMGSGQSLGPAFTWWEAGFTLPLNSTYLG